MKYILGFQKTISQISKTIIKSSGIGMIRKVAVPRRVGAAALAS